MMKQTLGAVAALAMVAGAHAGTIVINAGPYSFGQGGEFVATMTGMSFTPAALTNTGSFESFCLERSEQVNLGQTYFVDVDTVARLGGGGAVGGQDPLSEKTAYLYNAFITGTLPGYDYSNSHGDRRDDAGALQSAIWYLEHEVESVHGSQAHAFVEFAQGGVGRGLGDVRVLNLYTFDHGHVQYAQSQIGKIPTPGAVTLLGLGCVLVARRRRA